jgi:hypothetical protein
MKFAKYLNRDWDDVQNVRAVKSNISTIDPSAMLSIHHGFVLSFTLKRLPRPGYVSVQTC